MECCQSRSVEETSRAEEEEEKVESRLRWSSIFGVSRARNRWTKWFPVSFTFAWNLRVWACLQLAVGGRAMVQRTSVTREEAVHLPCRILSQGEQRAPREGMSAVIPKRGMLLYRLDKRYDTRGATIIAIEWLFVLLKGPFTLRKRTV